MQRRPLINSVGTSHTLHCNLIPYHQNLWTEWRSSIHEPCSRVLANGLCSESFTIAHGTQEGCTDSPLVFDLALEPFACTIQQSEGTKDIKVWDTEFKLMSYADYGMVLPPDPEYSLPALRDVTAEFRKLTGGYHINWNKSYVLSLGGPVPPKLRKQ